MKKFLCSRVLLLSCLVCCLMLAPVSAVAVPYTYTYTGSNFTDITDNDPPAGQYTTAMRVEATFTTLNGLLPDSTSYYDVRPFLATWSFSDGRVTLGNFNSDFKSNFKHVQVTGGLITDWSLGAEALVGYPEPGGIAYGIGTNSEPGQTSGIHDDAFIVVNVGSDAEAGFDPSRDDAISYSRGVWSDPQAVPEPTTMLLFGAGLVGLAGFGRKKFKK